MERSGCLTSSSRFFSGFTFKVPFRLLHLFHVSVNFLVYDFDFFVLHPIFPYLGSLSLWTVSPFCFGVNVTLLYFHAPYRVIEMNGMSPSLVFVKLTCGQLSLYNGTKPRFTRHTRSLVRVCRDNMQAICRQRTVPRSWPAGILSLAEPRCLWVHLSHYSHGHNCNSSPEECDVEST